jgi:hypothetical protein
VINNHSGSIKERREVLMALLNYEKPLHIIKNQLAVFQWDSESELVFLFANHIENILKHFQKGDIQTNEVEAWANLIEGRDDIGFEPLVKELLRSIIYELANPRLTQSLTIERSTELLKIIKKQRGRDVV